MQPWPSFAGAKKESSDGENTTGFRQTIVLARAQRRKINHLAGEGIHQEALAISFPLDIPAGSDVHEPVIGRAHDPDIIAPHLHTGIGARRAAVSTPSEVKQENLNLGRTSTGRGAGRASTRAAAHAPHAGAVGKAGEEAEHGAQDVRQNVRPQWRRRRRLAPLVGT